MGLYFKAVLSRSVCVYVCVCVSLCVYVCVYIHLHLQHTKKQATSDPTFSASAQILDILLPGRFHIDNLCIKAMTAGNISKVDCHYSVEEAWLASW